jgi:uncharacterized Zn-binding protein involved in type VI secretion
MALAARVGDPSGHGGVVAGPGVPNVTIEHKPAAVAGDQHVCPVPQPHPPSPFAHGSATVFIGGRPALRVGDVCGCGAPISFGAGTVMIGG